MVSPVDNYATPRNETTQFHFFLNSFRATPEKTSSDGSVTKGLLTKLEKQYEEASKNRGNGIGKIHPNWKRLTKFQMLDRAYEDEEERRIATSKLAKLLEDLTEDEYKEVVEIWRYIHKRSWEIEEGTVPLTR